MSFCYVQNLRIGNVLLVDIKYTPIQETQFNSLVKPNKISLGSQCQRIWRFVFKLEIKFRFTFEN